MLFMPGVESPSKMSLVGGTRGKKELIINNYPNSDISDGGDTGLLLGINLLEDDGSGICGATVAGRERFCM